MGSEYSSDTTGLAGSQINKGLTPSDSTMKPAFLVLPMLLCLVSCSNAESVSTYANNLTEAKLLAKQYDRYIFMHVSADDCAPCRRMDKEVLNKAGKAKLSSQFVYFSVKYENNLPLMDEMNLTSAPISIVLDKHGNVVSRLDGYRGAQHFNAWIRTF